MRTDLPHAIKLENYEPYPFEIEKVDLVFDLDPGVTRVVSTLTVKRRFAEQSSMKLDGEGLTLKSIFLDGNELAEDRYQVDETSLTLLDVPDAFQLRIEVEINPSANTALSGLYMSGGRFCTQCEATGFRHITYWPDRPDVMSKFRVLMSAEREAYPVLLSNGSQEFGQTTIDRDGTRHMAKWNDPHKKPSYLFALCAGDYDIYKDSFTTSSGRKVALAIHVDKGEADRASWAMDCLKRAMAWDEQVFGREYDLDMFNVVAVRDFNFGAMENKGLNIFNSAYVLADEATATDADFEAIESIVAHEYFHNWTGNRITCRDWFQLCLKEGLTVFRDQEFSADMRSRPVQRIKDVIRLRARQFPEDAGPLAHSVRPSEYGSVDNLYTATVYEKGAELIRMLKRLIGDAAFADGLDLYFNRHDGEAVTIEDFYACFEETSDEDLSQFRLWYAQAGTPTVTLTEDWNEEASELTFTFTQSVAPTQNQPDKAALPIPLAAALLSAEGTELQDLAGITLYEETETFGVSLPAGTPRPLLSLARGFSAPIRIERGLTQDEQFALVRAETDLFNRWDLLQGLLKAQILSVAYSDAPENPALISAIVTNVQAVAQTDPAYASLLLRLPDTGEILLDHIPADPAALSDARTALKRKLATELAPFITETLSAPAPAPFRPDAAQAGRRGLRAACMDLAAHDAGLRTRLPDLFANASSMTEQLAALGALTTSGAAHEGALDAFYAQWTHNPLIIDKWFAVQARAGDIQTIQSLREHPDFDLANPNRVRALGAVFAIQNLAAFHAPDGSGYEFICELITTLDPLNPALAARLLTGFEQWKSLAPEIRAKAEAILTRLAGSELSDSTRDILARTQG